MGRYMNELSVQETGEFGAYVTDFPKDNGHGEFVTLNIGIGDSGVQLFLPRQGGYLRDVQAALAVAIHELADVTAKVYTENTEREAEQPDLPVYRIYIDGQAHGAPPYRDGQRREAVTAAARMASFDPEAFIEVVFEHGSIRCRVAAWSPYEQR